MNIVITAVLLVAGLGLLLGLVIGLVAKVFAVESDPRVEEVGEMLPGANCGACGFAGCADFAQALVDGRAQLENCPVCSSECRGQIADFLGLSASEGEKMVAVVLCGGDRDVAKPASLYNGVSDCKSASLVAGGAKGCHYGCLGFGSCARACPFGAIEMTANGLAVVHPELCVGCGKCVETCPRHLIRMVPAKYRVHVYCNSPEKGGVKRKVCSVSCIGCRKCIKIADENQMLMDGFLARTNYEHADPASPELVSRTKCPTGCLHCPPGVEIPVELAEEDNSEAAA